jgi:GR25 family glycosyltransferase involved in LPS biosynthesis
MKSIKDINDIKHAFYINLDYRVDRKNHIEKQLKSVGIKAERFNAIAMENGALGCSFSHLRCLEIAYNNDWDHVFICEDDLTFLEPITFIYQIDKFFKYMDINNWDVLMLGGNIVPPFKQIDNYCVKIERCLTTTGYIVNKHYIHVLIENIKNGIDKLYQNPELKTKYAIDVNWFPLQKKDNWYLITPLTVIQEPGYSDIEKKTTNYKHLMIDLNKTYLTKSFF